MPSAPESAGPQAPAPARREDEWWRVSLTVSADALELTTALFEQVTPAGVVVDWPFQQGEDFGEVTLVGDAGTGGTLGPRVCCYVPASQLSDARALLRVLLERAGRGAEFAALEFDAQRRSDWETAFHRYLQPVRAGRLLVRPRPCAEVPRRGEIVVNLEPGLAFGTGGHPSTRMALAALERVVRPGDRVLDVGTGSGILACAAGKLGAASVHAFDIDPQAVEAALRNVALNGLANVEVRLADAPAVGKRDGATPGDGDPYDVVVANISAGVIVTMLPALAANTRPGGHCLLGGIIAPQLPRVAAALRATPLQQHEVDSDGEWRSISLTRAARVR